MLREPLAIVRITGGWRIFYLLENLGFFLFLVDEYGLKYL